MKSEYLVYALTLLSAVDVVLTRLRLRQAGAAGQHQVGMAAVNLHTVTGVIALLCWVPFLVLGHDNGLLGVVGLFFYWIAVIAGLMILMRWMPSRGKHASDSADDNWSEGPWLSMLAHLGLLVGVVVFTWYYGTHG